MAAPSIPEPLHERRRAEIVAKIPASYSPTLHLAVPTAIGAGVMIAALAGLGSVRAVDLLTVPLTLLAGFGFEWRAHKDVLHKRAPGLGLLYERHELAHHVLYTYDDLELRDRRELAFILMPRYAIVLVFLMVVPFAIAIAFLASPASARLMVATSMLFFLSYEWLHLAYHLPAESRIGRVGWLRVLRALHRRHHDPRLMKRWNFNVTVPVFDVVHRTLWSPGREARRAARSAAGPGPLSLDKS